jgi:hypothetical protein
VPFLLLTSALAVSWAHFGFPEQQATSQTRPVNSQGVPLSGVVPAVYHSACVGCLDFDATRRKNSGFGTPAPSGVAATNNLMTDLYSANKMSGLFMAWSQVPKIPLKNWPPHLLSYVLIRH